MITETFSYLNSICQVVFDRYESGNIHIQLTTMQNMPMATATINIPEFNNLYGGHDAILVLIKDYAENEGMVDLLATHGYIKRTGLIWPTGLVKTPICVLTPECVELIKEQGV